MNRTLITVVIIILVVLGVWYFMAAKDIEAPSDTDTATTTDENMNVGGDTSTTTGVGVNVGGDVSVGVVKEFSVSSSNFKFSVSEIKVNKGDTVRIALVNTAGTHDLKVDGYNIGTKTLSKAGETDTIEFVADKAGTFEYFCTIGTHRQMGMVGKLIVE